MSERTPDFGMYGTPPEAWESTPSGLHIPPQEPPLFTTAEEAWIAQQEHIEDLKIDALTGALTRVGFKHELKVNTELREALAAAFTGPELTDDGQPRACGVIMLDKRGVKAANRLFTYAGGDAFLEQGMGIIGHELTSSARTGRRRPEGTTNVDVRTGERRKSAEQKPLDALIRWGGDEIVIVVANISKEELELLAGRLITSFNGDTARRRYEAGQVPVIAGVGWASSEELPDLGNRPTTPEGLFATVKTMVSIADARQTIDKSNQYDQMWAAYLQTRERTQRALLDRPEDESRIIELWWRTFFPEFVNNPQRYLSPPKKQPDLERPDQQQ